VNPAAGLADSGGTLPLGMPTGVNPMAAMGMPMAMPGADFAEAGYGGEAGASDGDLFAVLQSLLARNAHATSMGAGMPGIPGGAAGGVAGAGVVQVPGFPPIMTAGPGGGTAAAYGGVAPTGGSAGGFGVPALPGVPVGAGMPGGIPLAPAGDGVPLPQRYLQGAELIGSLTRLQHGDVAALPGGLSGIDLTALISGTANVVRSLKSSGLGDQVDQTDGVTIDIVAMLFDQIFGDERVPEALKALIGRLQIPVVKVAVLDKKFFSRKSHPARRMLDTLGEFALGLEASFDQSSPLYKQIESIIARLLEDFVDNVDIFETLHAELLAVIREENKRAEIAAKEMARKIAYKERLEVGKAMAQLEIKNRAQATQMPQLIQKFLTDEWVKLLLLTYARHGQDSDAWKSALETIDHLIWSVTSKPSVEERRKLAHLLPGLLRRLQVGLQSINAPEEKRKRFFTRLMRMHTKAMSGAVAKPAVQPRSVPTLSEEVVPAPATEPMHPAPELAIPSIPAFDFGLEALTAYPSEATQPVAEHVLAAPSLPSMPAASTVTARAADAVLEADEDAQPASALEFSSVTISNPFGDGEIEVEEISLSDLPGFGNAASNDADAGTTDQYGQAVKSLKAGDWLEFRDGGQNMQARLSYISPLKGTYLFVNRRGEKVGEYSLLQLAQELRGARAVVLADVPLIDRAMSSLVGALKKNTR
jgi:hypothetical protein